MRHGAPPTIGQRLEERRRRVAAPRVGNVVVPSGRRMDYKRKQCTDRRRVAKLICLLWPVHSISQETSELGGNSDLVSEHM